MVRHIEPAQVFVLSELAIAILNKTLVAVSTSYRQSFSFKAGQRSVVAQYH